MRFMTIPTIKHWKIKVQFTPSIPNSCTVHHHSAIKLAPRSSQIVKVVQCRMRRALHKTYSQCHHRDMVGLWLCSTTSDVELSLEASSRLMLNCRLECGWFGGYNVCIINYQDMCDLSNWQIENTLSQILSRKK